MTVITRRISITTLPLHAGPRAHRIARGLSATDLAKKLMGYEQLYRTARTVAKKRELEKLLESKTSSINRWERVWERKAAGEACGKLPSDATALRIARACGYDMNVWYTLPPRPPVVRAAKSVRAGTETSASEGTEKAAPGNLTDSRSPHRRRVVTSFAPTSGIHSESSTAGMSFLTSHPQERGPEIASTRSGPEGI